MSKMERDITPQILELIRLTSTDLPCPVERKLRTALELEEPGSAAHSALETILANVEITRRNSTPICQDTGTPIFIVSRPALWDSAVLRAQIRAAVAEATSLTYLRPNAVDSLNGKNTGNNLGDEYFPTIHFREAKDDRLVIDLLLKGGGCENVGRQYSLPDLQLKAGRDLGGVHRAALDAVYRAQGEGCAPGFLGIAIGGDRGTSYLASKEALFADFDQPNPDVALASLERQILEDANQLGIGPMGFGGKTTLLGVKITAIHRLPASYFISVSYMCWAFRRRRMCIDADQVSYK
jgi:fumarate hydratase class I